MTETYLRSHFPHSAWDGRIGPLFVAGAALVTLLAIVVFAA